MPQRRSAHPGERPFARLSRGSSMPRLHRFALALAASTAMVAAGPAFAKAKAGEAAPISDLVKAVDIPYQAFTLDNGLRSEEHTSELQSLMRISYAVFCLKQKNKTQQ